MVDSAVAYSVSGAARSVKGFAVERGLMEGMQASVMARRVFHWSGVRGSSLGKGGSGVAFGDTGSVGRDIGCGVD